jgi:polysaccharide deacetylase 2 family uncharacterized protein YibQ
MFSSHLKGKWLRVTDQLKRRISVTAVVMLASVDCFSANHPTIALVIDDLGYSEKAAESALALPGEVTYSVLPRTPFASSLASRVLEGKRELMIHLPMQALNDQHMAPGGLRLDMDRQEFTYRVQQALDEMPGAAGINNHMGSLLTRDIRAMNWLMQLIVNKGEMYFLDSRTDRETVAQSVAIKLGIPNTRRDVFLDNEPRSVEYLEQQFALLVSKAKKEGTALGVAHPHPETLDVLKDKLGRLDDYGVKLVSVSKLIEQQGRDR